MWVTGLGGPRPRGRAPPARGAAPRSAASPGPVVKHVMN